MEGTPVMSEMKVVEPKIEELKVDEELKVVKSEEKKGGALAFSELNSAPLKGGNNNSKRRRHNKNNSKRRGGNNNNSKHNNSKRRGGNNNSKRRGQRGGK